MPLSCPVFDSPFWLKSRAPKGQGLAAGVIPKPWVFNPKRDWNFGSGLDQLTVLQVRGAAGRGQQVVKV